MRWIGLIVFALAAFPSQAQQTVSIQTQVTFIAGQTVFVSAGTEDGLAAGDTLDVLRDGSVLGQMSIVSATADRSVLGFLDEPFAVTMGDHLTLRKVERIIVPEVINPDTVSVVERPSILDPVDERPEERNYTSPRINGRIQIGIDGFLSSTNPGGGASSVDRTYATPFALVRLGVQDIPGGFAFNTRFRTAYRYANPTPFGEEIDVRVYDVSLEKSFESLPLEIRAGRIYNRFDRFSGYLDGASVHVGDRERGVGVTAGFQPDRGNEMPTGDLPKYTVYGHAAYENESLRYEGTALGGQVIPQTAGLETRTFAGMHHQVYAGQIRASADVLVDQDPETGEWVFSRLGGRATLNASRDLRLRGYAMSRRSYILFGSTQRLLPVSSRIGGGATFTIRGGPLPGTSLQLDVSNSMAESRPNTLTVTGGISIPRLRSTGFGIMLNGTVWQNEELDETRRGIYGNAGISKSFGSIYSRISYRYQQSPLLGTSDLITHGLDAMLQVPLQSGLALTLQASSYFSDRISSTRLYSALWYRF